MPIRSMTGYGAGSFELAADRYRLELRSVNHKTLEIRIRCPREFMMVEPDLHKVIRSRLTRGFVDVHIDPDNGESVGYQAIVNTALFDAYLSAWHSMARRAGIVSSPSLRWLASQDGVLGVTSRRRNANDVREAVVAGCERALDHLVAFRKHEGVELGIEIGKCLDVLGHIVDQIEDLAPIVVKRAQDKAQQWLNDRTVQLHEFSDGRLEQELVLLAARSDITEEIGRLRAHIQHTKQALLGEFGDSVGKRLGFLVQELFREATTIGAKAGDHTLSQLSIEARCEIEKIREQSMNIE